MAEEAGFLRWVRDASQALAARAADLEPGVFEPALLLDVVSELEKLRRLAGALTVRCAADAVRRDAWRSSGARSAEAWYARVTGTTVSAAARKLGTQRKVADNPDVDQAVRAGDLSSDQADKVAAATAEDPTAATRLLRQAKQGTARQLNDECERTIAAKRRADDEERRKRTIHAERHLRFWTDQTGAARLSGSMLPEQMAQFQACLAPFVEAEFHQARTEGRREAHEAYRLDGLLAMARAATADDTGAGPPATVIAVVSHEALTRGHTEEEETCRLDGIGPVPVSTVRAMMADAFLATVVTDGVDIRCVAHPGRQVTSTQRTALTQRDPICVVPGCGARDGLEIDHVTGWAATHITTMDDLARLCRRHHRMKTYRGWTLHGPPGQWQWKAPSTTGPAPVGASPPRSRDGPSGQDHLFTAADPPAA